MLIDMKAAESDQPQFSPLVRLFRALGPARGMVRQRSIGPRPQVALELFSMEGCPACRRVRVAMTELDLDYVHRSCPRGESPNRARLSELGGRAQVPFLVDANTGAQLYESRAIVRYLQQRYGTGE
jgi:glutaredoxin